MDSGHTDRAGSRALNPALLRVEWLAALGYFFSAAIAIQLTRVEGGIALIWPANAIAASLLIRARRVHWPSAAILVVAASIAVNLSVGDRPWPIALLFTGFNGTEIALSVWIFRSVARFRYPDISINESFVMTAVMGIAIPGLVALAGGEVLYGYYGQPLVQGIVTWWSSHTLGACLVAPPLILYSKKATDRLLSTEFRTQNLVSVLVVLAGCFLTIRYVHFPYVAISVLLLVAAVRLGGYGTAVLSLIAGFTVAALWAIGIRPEGLVRLPTDLNLVGLPVLPLLCAVMPAVAVGIGTDMRRAIVRELHFSERRFRESMDRSPLGMLIANLDGVWGYTNIALQRMLGYSAEEFLSMPPGGPSEPDEWQGSHSRWRRLIKGEIDSYDVERRFRHKDGHWIWTHVAVSLARDEDDVPLYLIAQIESLEARRRAEERLAEERERLRITLTSIDDAVITTDAQTHITYVNAAAETMLGLSMEAVHGRLVDEVIHLMDPQTSRAAANLIGQSAIHAKVFRRQNACLLHRPDGSICFVMDVVSPVLDSSGVVSGMVIVLRDATTEMSSTQDLKHRANHDPLTGLYNRSAFQQRLVEVFERAQQLDRPAALLAIDLDRFKAVNDSAGHAAGDAVLLKVAEACRAHVRSSDTVARLGGDEFAIILDNCSAERADAIGGILLKALNPLQVGWQGSTYCVGASIGVATWNRHMANERDWLAVADEACYLAKRAGRGQMQRDHARRAG
jgi:diguanylate cyclase (GGDEF)-like protein/PAS domain S-box-containing protein